MTIPSHLEPDSTKLPKSEPATERKRAEIALEQERTKLRTLFRTIPDVIWAKDKKGKYLGCNPAFERLCGMSEADIIGKTDEDMGELDMFDDEGHINGTLSIARDVTEVRRNQHLLHERVKEQQCLYEIFNLTEDLEAPLEKQLQQVVERIPPDGNIRISRWYDSNMRDANTPPPIFRKRPG